MKERWREFEHEASEVSEGNLVNVLAKAWYRTLEPTEKSLANQVLVDWILHGTSRQQVHALALIWEFRIRTAEPALHQLAGTLDRTPGPEAKYLAKKVRRIIDALNDRDDEHD